MYTALLTIVVFCLSVVLFLVFQFKRPKNFPPGPVGLPFVGNAPFLRKLTRELGYQHLAFIELAKRYKTPVVGLRLGKQLVAVVVEQSAVWECLSRDEFIGRPDSFFIQLRCFGKRRGITCAEGDLWHTHRIFTLRTLRDLGMGKQRMEDLILNQVKEVVDELEQGNQPQEPIKTLFLCILQVLWEISAGKRLSSQDPTLLRLIKILNLRNKAFDMAGGILSQFPWLRLVAPDATGYSMLTKLNMDMKTFLLEVVTEHKLTYNPDVTRDMIDSFLHEMTAKNGEENSFTEDQLLIVLLDLFLGGATSTVSTLDFALLFMVRYPEIQEKVYQEIYDNVGLSRLPSVADRPRLLYTRAVVMEIQRMCNISPMAGPRRVVKDTNFCGYDLPKDTTVLMNLWAVHMDEKLYPNPSLFQPERFLDETAKSNRFKNFLPFGAGKRRCLGENLAEPCLFLIFAGIIQAYQLVLPPGASVPTTDPSPGILLTPKPYSVIFSKRTKTRDPL